MGGQDECSEFDASTRTRTLTPSSESLVSNHETSVVESKKRKRERSTMEDLLDESFVVKVGNQPSYLHTPGLTTIQPHPSTVFSKPHTLNPIALIPRTHVPLSFLDILSPSGPLPASRLFEAHVKVLELEERMRNAPAVLIALCDDGKSIFVVERMEQNLYVLCKLGSWVSISRLCMGAIISKHQSFKAAASRSGAGSVLHKNKVESDNTPESSKYSKKKRLAIEAIQSMVKRPSRDGLSTLQDQARPFSQSGTVMESQSSKEPKAELIQEDINGRPMATQIFDNIRSQYFEALYLSKVSHYLKEIFW
jgi:DNA replication regulator SLD3